MNALRVRGLLELPCVCRRYFRPPVNPVTLLQIMVKSFADRSEFQERRPLVQVFLRRRNREHDINVIFSSHFVLSLFFLFNSF